MFDLKSIRAWPVDSVEPAHLSYFAGDMFSLQTLLRRGKNVSPHAIAPRLTATYAILSSLDPVLLR